MLILLVSLSHVLAQPYHSLMAIAQSNFRLISSKPRGISLELIPNEKVDLNQEGSFSIPTGQAKAER